MRFLDQTSKMRVNKQVQQFGVWGASSILVKLGSQDLLCGFHFALPVETKVCFAACRSVVLEITLFDLYDQKGAHLSVNQRGMKRLVRLACSFS